MLGLAFGSPVASDPPTARELEGSAVVHLEDGHYHMSVHRRKDGTLWRVIELSEHYSPIVERVSEAPLTITVFEPQPAKQ